MKPDNERFWIKSGMTGHPAADLATRARRLQAAGPSSGDPARVCHAELDSASLMKPDNERFWIKSGMTGHPAADLATRARRLQAVGHSSGAAASIFPLPAHQAEAMP
ncbi:MAG: hypothetical protein O3B04_08245 [Chloroflexi bacterium]|nr:hypothetical protein [Chloroflexota bacterium]